MPTINVLKNRVFFFSFSLQYLTCPDCCIFFVFALLVTQEPGVPQNILLYIEIIIIINLKITAIQQIIIIETKQKKTEIKLNFSFNQKLIFFGNKKFFR